jgi:hypothetical protein
MGFLVDRYTDDFEVCDRDPFLQYQDKEEYTAEFMKTFTPPWLRKTSWPLTRRSKVLMSKVSVGVAFEGSHICYEIAATDRVLTDFRIEHFAWRESAKQKIAVKSYFTQENLAEVYKGEAPFELVSALHSIRPEILYEK